MTDNNDENKNTAPPETNESDGMTDDVTFEEVHEEGDELEPKAQIKKLKEKIKKLEAEKNDNLHGWTRAQADYVNFRKEIEGNRKEDIKFASKKLINNILPALDSYSLAKSNKEAWEKVDANWRTGIEYIFSQLQGALEKEGLEAYGMVGDAFDPRIHESVEVVKTDKEDEDGKIVALLQMGYKLNNQVLRPAKVKTGEFESK